MSNILIVLYFSPARTLQYLFSSYDIRNLISTLFNDFENVESVSIVQGILTFVKKKYLFSKKLLSSEFGKIKSTNRYNLNFLLL